MKLWVFAYAFLISYMGFTACVRADLPKRPDPPQNLRVVDNHWEQCSQFMIDPSMFRRNVEASTELGAYHIQVYDRDNDGREDFLAYFPKGGGQVLPFPSFIVLRDNKANTIETYGDVIGDGLCTHYQKLKGVQ